MKPFVDDKLRLARAQKKIDESTMTDSSLREHLASKANGREVFNAAKVLIDAIQREPEKVSDPSTFINGLSEICDVASEVSMVRSPTVAHELLHSARTKRYENEGRLSKKVFEIPDLDCWTLRCEHSRLAPEANLLLDTGKFGTSETGLQNAIRRTLGDTVLKVWLADMCLVQESKNRTGIHKVDPKRLLQLLGYKPRDVTVDGVTYQELDRDALERTKAAYDVLEHTYIEAIGNTKFITPEPLLRKVVGENRDGKRGATYVPSAFVVEMQARSFIQVPKAVPALPYDDIVIAMGLASVIRDTGRWAATGSVRMTLNEWAVALGEDVKAKTRKNGRAYWAILRDKIVDVSRDGDFGAARIEDGQVSADTVLELKVDGCLRNVYRKLRDKIEAHKNEPTGLDLGPTLEKRRGRKSGCRK